MRFSVIIPLFNKAPYVNKALDSIISQSFQDFELIVVDDGSTDDSLAVAQSIVEGCGVKYRLIHQDNAGVSSARNNGVMVSHGDYLCFLDADDWWAPTFLERMDDLIRTCPGAGIYGMNYYYVKNGRESISVKGVETGYINYCKVYSEGLSMPLWTGAVSLPRRVFDEMGGFRPRLKLGEDFDLWIKIVLKYRVAFLNEAHSYYFQDSDPAWRLIGKLHDPETHMLWNLDYLSDSEKSNPELKQLLDNLRTYGLFPYYLSKQFRNAAQEELSKVDWDKQSSKTVFLYKMPVGLLKIRKTVLDIGSFFKRRFIKFLHLFT